MDDRDLTPKDREHRLRLAIEGLKRREPKGEKPEDAVVPTLTAEGECRCPKCGKTARTPEAWNPWTGRDERMVLVPGKCNDCPNCGVRHFVTEELAQAHNHMLYPDDPQFFARRQHRKEKREDG